MMYFECLLANDIRLSIVRLVMFGREKNVIPLICKHESMSRCIPESVIFLSALVPLPRDILDKCFNLDKDSMRPSDKSYSVVNCNDLRFGRNWSTSLKKGSPTF